MGDWRTLHLFDSNRYKKEIIPAIKDTRSYLSFFLTENRMNWFSEIRSQKEEKIKQTIDFISELNSELIIHPELIKSQTRMENEPYNSFIQRSNYGFDSFCQSNLFVIEFFQFVLSESIFSTVSNFNPHFILGKGIFESCVGTKKNTIAQELTSKIISSPKGSILDLFGGSIINWIDNDELEMLHFDLDNIYPVDQDSENYISELKVFINLAYDRKLGLLSMRNPSERRLSQLHKIDPNLHEYIKDKNFKSIIIDQSVYNNV